MGPVSRWRTILATVVVAYGILLLAGIAVIYSGAYNVAADDPHWRLTHRIFETARARSITAQAAGIQVPPGMDDPAKLVMGVAHFADHCAVCHSAPGVPKGEIAQGLYPQPPELEHVSAHLSDAEMFWVIKHGIKMTGMPAWSKHSDEELWATVAFLKKLPGMTPEEYGKHVMAAMAHGGHRPPGSDTDTTSPAGQGATPGKDEHRH